jgi:glycosyltransferase involved in cell wall biosynthesis
MSGIRISVIICTHNRASYIGRTLDSMVQQTLESALYEIIVVDNASTDNTYALVQEKSRQHPTHQIKYVLEIQLGLSHARNRGIQESSGHYIVYLDDDAIATPVWLGALLDGFERLTPSPVCIGGKVILDWEGEEPFWVSAGYRHLFSCVDHGDAILYLNTAPSTKRWLIGANIAFDKAYLLNHHLKFAAQLGRRGSDLISGEESALLNALFSMNAPIYYLPEALVYHVVLPERRSYRYIVKRLIADGRSQPLIDHIRDNLTESKLKLVRRILYDIRMGVWFCLKPIFYLLRGKKLAAHQNFFTGLRYWGRAITEVSMLIASERPKG